MVHKFSILRLQIEITLKEKYTTVLEVCKVNIGQNINKETCDHHGVAHGEEKLAPQEYSIIVFLIFSAVNFSAKIYKYRKYANLVNFKFSIKMH